MNYHLVTVAALLAAVIFYIVGYATAGHLFIFLGVIAELVFWFRLIKPKTGG